MCALLMEQERYAEPMEYFADSLDINVISDNIISTNLITSHKFLNLQNDLNDYFVTKITSSFNEKFFDNLLITQKFEKYSDMLGYGYIDFYDSNILKRSENISTKDNLSKSDDELFKELYDSFDVPDIKEFDSQKFIMNCEEIYKKSTEEFIKEFIASDFEGNVDQQLWYHHAKLLKDNGDKI